MGDPRRHSVFASFISDRWPDRSLRIVDVAGGNGHLNAELHRRGYHDVVTIDKRQKRWTARPHYRYGLFTTEMAAEFDLVVAMHPDAATDVALAGAIECDIPYAVVPCCPIPTVWDFEKGSDWDWIKHLVERSGAIIEQLPMAGANLALVNT